MNINWVICILLFFSLMADAAYAGPSESELFNDSSVLDLSIRVDFGNLCRPRETPDCDYAPSVLGYTQAGKKSTIPIEIKVRGGWRSLSSNCQVPLLWIRFSDQETAGSPFEGQRNLPLTTHCGRSNLLLASRSSRNYLNYEQYLLKEYLAYRLYNQVTDLSLRVRLARVLYEDPERPGKGTTYYAFFTEHFESLAARHNLDLLPRKTFDYRMLDVQQADTAALFQFMIGNTDWSIARQRNTILLQSPDGVQIPVPYDLDMSGLVNAPYAGPPPSLPIKEVTDRYYLGYCHPKTDWSSLFHQFLLLEGQLHAQVPAIPGLYKKERSSAKRYLNLFFKTLNSPGKRQKSIIDACQSWPPTMEDHMAPAKPGT